MIRKAQITDDTGSKGEYSLDLRTLDFVLEM